MTVSPWSASMMLWRCLWFGSSEGQELPNSFRVAIWQDPPRETSPNQTILSLLRHQFRVKHISRFSALLDLYFNNTRNQLPYISNVQCVYDKLFLVCLGVWHKSQRMRGGGIGGVSEGRESRRGGEREKKGERKEMGWGREREERGWERGGGIEK